MRIGVIGAGWLGGTVGGVWAKAGHEVLFSSRHRDKLASMLVELGLRASAGAPAEAAAFGEVVLIAAAVGSSGRRMARSWTWIDLPNLLKRRALRAAVR
jgi:predicted dinucleotide-binding enzyme